MFVCIDLHPPLQHRYSEVTNLMVNELGGTNIIWGVVAANTFPLRLPRTTFCVYPSLTPKDFSAKLTEKLESIFKEGGWTTISIGTDGVWFHNNKPFTGVSVTTSNVRLESDIDSVRE